MSARRAAPALVALAVLAGAMAVAAPSAGLSLRFTHMVTLKVTVSDHWTRIRQDVCDPAGTGSMTFTQIWRHPVKAAPQIDPFAGNGGRWVLLVPGPGGHSALDLAAQKATGTITYTSQASVPTDSGCTDTVDSRGCRTYKLGATTNVFGIDRRSLRVLSTAPIGDQIRPPRSCLTGTYREFNDISFFHHDLSIRMASAAVLRTRRKVVLTGSDNGRVKDAVDASGNTLDETVTQTAVLTLTRIGRS